MTRRSRAPQIVLAVVALAATGFLAWWWWAQGHAASGSAAMQVPAVAPGDAAPAAVNATELASVPTAPQGADARAEAPRVAVAAEAPSAGELADAWWVEGRVKFPDDTPTDESVVVVAQGREFASKRLHRAPLNPDGTFRVAFSKQTKKAWLRLEARYVFLADTVAVEPAKEPRDVVLLPQLGGHVRGTCVLSAAAQPFARELVGASVTLTGWSGTMSGGPRQVVQRVADGLTFEFGGLDPGLRWGLSCIPKSFAPASVDVLPVATGKSVPFELAVTRGATLSGRVTDESGAPVAGVRVRVDDNAAERHMAEGDPKTDEDGRWNAVGVGADVLRIGFVKSGYVSCVLKDLKFLDGETRTGVDGVMTRGRAIRGTVTWSDGRPAADARVEAQRSSSNDGSRWFLREDDPSARTGADGTFEIVGVDEGEWDLTAAASNKAVQAAESASGKAAEKPAKSGRTAKGRAQATATGVAAGSTDVRIVLGGGGDLTGVVVDDAGVPVPSFGVTWSRVIEGQNWSRTESEATRTFQNAEGHFTITGLAPGKYQVAAVGKSKFQSENVTVHLPEDTTPLRLTLPRFASVRGRVVDPGGAPVAGAEVQIKNVEGFNRTWRYDRETEKKRRTNADGEFAFEYMASTWIVTASSPSWADAEGVEVVAPPGGEVGPLMLTLRRGGTVTGEAFDGEGKPARQRDVSLHGSGRSTETATDGDGRFRFERVTPGEWTVTLQPARDVQRAAQAKGDFDWSSIQPVNGSRTVTVVEGGTQHVSLGGAPKEPVRVTGVVRGSAPIAGANVSLMRVKSETDDSEWSADDWRSGRTDDEGRYTLLIEGGGEFRVTVNSPSGAQTWRKVTVAARATAVVDFQLPTASVSGVVLGADGKPARGVEVSASRKGPPHGAEVADGEASVNHGSTRSLADGTFRIEGLSSGTFTFIADDAHVGTGRNGSAPSLGVDVAVADGARVTGVELRLRAGGSIRGRVVREDGRPVADLIVGANPLEGMPDFRGWMSVQTQSDGSFRLEGVAPGRWSLRGIDGRTNEIAHGVCDVRAGEATPITLTLEEGGSVSVRVVDASGATVRRSIGIVDGAGIDWSMSLGWPDEADAPLEAGPLPRGTYRVWVPGVEGAEAAVEVGAGTTREVRLSVPSAVPDAPK